MPTRRATRDARPRLITAAIIFSLVPCLAAVLAVSAAAQAAPGPRLVEVELGPGVPFSALLEAGLDVIEVRGARRARLLEWPGL